MVGEPSRQPAKAMLPPLLLLLVPPAAIRWGSAPVLLAQGTGSASNRTHAWFPEGGCVVGVGELQAVIGAVRYCGDGAGTEIQGNNAESFASFDQGRTFAHLSYTSFVQGTPTYLNRSTGVLHGVKCPPTRAASNRSFVGVALRYAVLPNHTVTRTIAGTVTYSGFPYPVQGLTYMSRMINLSADGQILVQSVGFSPHATETPERLAAFRSDDGGAHWQFQQVIAQLNASLLAAHWEGPGENDIVRLADSRILAVFRVDSCLRYWSSISDKEGRVRTPRASLLYSHSCHRATTAAGALTWLVYLQFRSCDSVAVQTRDCTSTYIHVP